MDKPRERGVLLWTGVGLLIGLSIGFALDIRSFLWIYTDADLFMPESLWAAAPAYAFIGAVAGWTMARSLNRHDRDRAKHSR